MSFDPKEFLTGLFHTAVAAADPKVLLPGFLGEALKDFPLKKGLGNVVVIGAGKAAAAMALQGSTHIVVV